MISQSYCIEMCSAFGSVTSAHTYLPPFFLLFNHIPNDYNFSQLPVPVIKMPAASFLAIACPFSQVALSCGCCFIQLPPHLGTPGLPLPALFFLPQTWTSSWSIAPLHPAQQEVPSGDIPGPGLQPSLTRTGSLAQNHPLDLVPSPGS